MNTNVTLAQYLRRPLAVLTIIGILLIPGGLVASTSTSADTKLSASDKALIEEQKQWVDPEASVDTEAEAKDASANPYMDQALRLAMDAAPKATNIQANATQNTTAGGRWSRLPGFPNGTNAYHMTMGPGGKVLLTAGSGNNSAVFKAKSFKAFIWDPRTGIKKTIKVPEDMFCSGHALLANGQALIAGGTSSYGPWKGETSLYTFDFRTEKFTKQKNMNHGRWYPTVTTTPGGYALIIGGLNAGGRNAGTSELYNPSTRKSADKATRVFPLYPQIFATADHRYFYTGGGWANSAKDTTIHKPGFWDPGTNKFVPVGGLAYAKQRGQGASCRVGDARNQDFIIMGGGWPATSSVQLINLRAKNPAYRNGPSLPNAKTYVSCVQLPDGSLLELNGGNANKIANAKNDVAILANANATKWQIMNPIPTGEHRLYHSSAFLMDDGSVVSFGSNPSGQARSNTVLRYEPPYLFKGARPTLSSVPSAMTYGKTYTLGVSADVKKITITTAPSPTHSTDTNQKQVTLPVVNGKVTMSFNSYQFGRAQVRIFAINDQGVPSVAKWSRIQ